MPLKGSLELLLGSTLAVAVGKRRLCGARLTLAYHNIVRSERPPIFADASLHLPLHLFCEQMDAIVASGIRVVPLDAAANSRNGDPQIAITFDDAYAGALNAALPELASRGFPATVFVAPGILGLSASWWDRLANPSHSSVPADVRQAALTELQGDCERVSLAAAKRGWPLQEAAAVHRIGTEVELHRAMSEHPRLSLGAHSWGHLNLSSLDRSQLHEELLRPLEWLRDRWSGRVLPWLAYPYGLASPAVRRAAADTGYAAGLMVHGGWDKGVSDRFTIPRVNVTSGLSIQGFRARLAGLI